MTLTTPPRPPRLERSHRSRGARGPCQGADRGGEAAREAAPPEYAAFAVVASLAAVGITTILERSTGDENASLALASRSSVAAGTSPTIAFITGPRTVCSDPPVCTGLPRRAPFDREALHRERRRERATPCGAEGVRCCPSCVVARRPAARVQRPRRDQRRQRRRQRAAEPHERRLGRLVARRAEDRLRPLRRVPARASRLGYLRDECRR